MITPSEEFGGAERHTLLLCIGAQARGWQVSLACPRSNKRLADECGRLGISYTQLEVTETSALASLQAKVELARNVIATLSILRKLRPDAVLVTIPDVHPGLPEIFACAISGTPCAALFTLFPRLYTPGKLRRRLYRIARASNQRWITLSRDNRNWLSKSLDVAEAKIDVIYAGTNVQPSLPASQRSDVRRRIRQELALPDDSFLVLTVARLSRQKGYETLTKVIPYLRDEFPKARFVWVGDGLQAQEIAASIRACGLDDRVTLLGHRDDVHQLLQAADLFVLPTLFEGGQSFALIEAMAHQVPLVTTRVSGIPEVIDDRIHGLLCEPADTASLLEAMRWAMRNPSEMSEMSKRARVRVEEFTESRMTNQTLDVLDDLANGTGNSIADSAGESVTEPVDKQQPLRLHKHPK